MDFCRNGHHQDHQLKGNPVYEFRLLKANSVQEAVYMLQNEKDAKIIAGGMTLLPTMKQRLSSPSTLIDLSSIKQLQEIEAFKEYIEIGSLCTHYEVFTSKIIQKYLPSLSKLAGLIADPQVRFKGTIGGSIANNDPSADYPAALIGLGGIVVTNLREISSSDFIVGMFSTCLGNDEVIQSLRFPIGYKTNYQKFKHPSSGYALCGVWLSQKKNEQILAVTGVFSNAKRWVEGENAIAEKFNPKSFQLIKIDLDDIFITHDSTKAYKAQLVRVLSQRAFEEISK
jgi:carbon-monoxide dehydrogenase medium subunit